MLSNSVCHCCAASGVTLCPNLGMQTMSCQTNRPSRSAVIVPAVGMGFDVYAHHVAGDLFEVLEVEEDGFVRWRGEDAVGPIAPGPRGPS